MSSIAGIIGPKDLMAYGAAKGGVRLVTKSVAKHCHSSGYKIRCNSIHPGFINTPMVQKEVKASRGLDLTLDSPEADAFKKAMNMGDAGDVANLVLFLVSDDSKHINGTEITIDNTSSY